jgi:hypothetical protein
MDLPPTVTSIALPSPTTVDAPESVSEECPAPGGGTGFTYDDFMVPDLDTPLMAHLNAGGDPEAMPALISEVTAPVDPPAKVEANGMLLEVTGAGQPEVVIWMNIPGGGDYIDTAFIVLGCRNGAYARLLYMALRPLETFEPDDGYILIAGEDVNGDSVADLVIDLKVGAWHKVNILSWGGGEFISLVEPTMDPITLVEKYTIDFAGTVQVEDATGDGLPDLVLDRQPDPMIADDTGGIQIWAWDGTALRVIE